MGGHLTTDSAIRARHVPGRRAAAKAGAAGQAGQPRIASVSRAAVPTAGGPAAPHGRGGDERGREAPRLPPVRLAPREELAGRARVAPLLRAARELARWLGRAAAALDGGRQLPPADGASAAMAELELTPGELDAAWRVAARTGMLAVAGGRAGAGGGWTCWPPATPRKCSRSGTTPSP